MKHGIGERVATPAATASIDEKLLFARHAFAYDEAAGFVAQKRVLEIGCGTAFGARKLGPLCEEFAAVDIDAALIDGLNQEKKSGHFSNAVSFLHYDGKRLPFSDGYFSVILSFQVIEHVPDDLIFLNELARVLAKGGVILITTPNRLIRLMPGQKPFNNYHTREYSPEDFSAMVRKTPLKLHLSGVFGDAFTQALETQRLKKYHSFGYRYLFQSLPRGLQQALKDLYLRRRKTTQENVVSAPLKFFRSTQDLDRSVDLWAELRH